MKLPKRWLLVAAALIVVTTGVVTAYIALLHEKLALPELSQYYPLGLTFDGPSTGLRKTQVVATLDTAMADRSNVIWSASFQLAWKQLASDVANGPIHLRRDVPLVEHLNRSRNTSVDIPPDSLYVAAGRVRNGIVAKVQQEMSNRFPGVILPSFGNQDVVIAYGYLEAAVPFPLPYINGETRFVDTSGREVRVRAFGIRQQERFGAQGLRKQPKILFTNLGQEQPTHFAIDLCQESQPNQIVVARVNKGRSLAETLGEVDRRIKEYGELNDRSGRFGPADELLVPAMHWRVSHEFVELENETIENGEAKGTTIQSAFQTIELRLDQGGAEVKSQAGIELKSAPRLFYLNGPFLVYIKKRGADGPFFAMWIENSEMLVSLP
jgi:hypothetical protein